MTLTSVPEGFAARLSGAIGGSAEFGAGARALYTMDASNYRQAPLAVVTPRDDADVVAAVNVAREFGVPVVPRGGGTSVAGNAVGNGVVLDFSRHMNRILDIDPVRRVARVEPGVVLDDLQAAAATHGLVFGPDPSTSGRCTIGGMIGNDACGSHSIRWGRTSDNVQELDVLLYDGTRMRVNGAAGGAPLAGTDVPERVARLYRDLRDLVDDNLAVLRTGFPELGRRVSGYALDALLPERGFNVARSLVGTEGTCATVLSATVRLVPMPAAKALLVLGFPDDIAAAETVPGLLRFAPMTVEGLDARLLRLSASARTSAAVPLPDGGAWLFVEIAGASAEDAAHRAAEVARSAGAPAAVVTDGARQRALWRVRAAAAGLATRAADGSEAWPGWEDAAVPPHKLAAYLREFRALLVRHGREGVTFGHFGEGCVHVRIDFDLTDRSGIRDFREFVEEAAELVIAHGGSLSGEHGDGRARSELLRRMYSPELIGLFERFKATWDPANGLNPGVIVKPRRLDEDLRFGRRLPLADTAFGYPHDDGDFAQAVRRCVGVGKCREPHASAGVMCPSFQATREEKDSTRGRARVLLEMVNGQVITEGWRSGEVRDALDLCLSCKGCRSDCPVGVDMATYKAEFLHHHYRHRLRPAAHYSMGYLPTLARLASAAPATVNKLTDSAVIGRILRRLGGIAAERSLPAFARTSFTKWLTARRPTSPRSGTPAVMVWPDTFTEHFSPEVGQAATTVLEAAGFAVRLPPGRVCCGLTWISTGQLAVARRVILRTLGVLEPALAAGTPIVGLEPSCTAALRVDVPELVADDRARRLADQVFTLPEFLDRADWAPPELPRGAIRQIHCHQHAVLGSAADERLFARMRLDSHTLRSGCCGLAGNFGFERGHYEISRAIGERVLLPAVRSASPDTIVLADGFSCRTQIADATDRRALHLAQILELALIGDASGRPAGT